MKYIPLSKQYYKDRNGYEQLYQERFGYETTVHLPILINGNEAFFTYSEEVLQLICDIYKEDKWLYITLRELPLRAQVQFRIRCLIDEIKATNDIEGVHSTRKEIEALLESLDEKKKKRRLYGLVLKYLMLIDGENISMESCQDIRKLYDELLLFEIEKENPENKPDGVFFRTGPVHIQGADLKIIHSGVQPESQIISYMEEGLKLLNNEAVNELVAISAFHYLLGYIHPFYDGNGRLNRFISSYLLSRVLEPMAGINLSNVIMRDVKTYYKAFETVNNQKNRGDITPFVITFLEFIYRSMVEMEATLEEKRRKLDYYCFVIDKMALDYNRKGLLKFLTENTLFNNKGMLVEEMAERMELSIPTIRNYLKDIEEGLLLVSRDGRKKRYDINFDYFK